ncbi:hypothetical protein QJQ45_016440 [Haematococcus lacustris]|nr:hypothetical protein QJQ45_016440 [Haematococcus lacustris]
MEKEKVALAEQFGLPDVAATYRSAPWGMHQRLANGAKPHLDATARALFLQWIETKAENAIKQSKSPSSKDAEQATPVKAITGNMGKLHWSFGAAWNSFGATQQQQPVMGNSQLVDGSLEQL